MNPDRWSSWAPQVLGVDYPDSRVATATTGRVYGPLWVTFDFDIVDVDETNWTWTWTAWWRTRSIGMTLTHSVASRPDGSRTWLEIVGSPLLVVPYAPAAKIALMRLVAA
jgi:hypothetical protein